MAEFASQWSDEVVDQFASATTSAKQSAAMSQNISAGTIDDKIMKVSRRIIKRNDKNGDEVLTPSEWKVMLMSPAKSDSNRDKK